MQQSDMDKVTKELQDTKLVIEDLKHEVSDKDNVIIELYNLKEKDEENYKSRIEELNQELQDKVRTINQLNQELLDKNGTLDQLNGDFDGLKSELERYKHSAKELEKNLDQAQKFNAIGAERLHTEHQEELQAVNSKHLAELENLKQLMNMQLEETGQEADKSRQEQMDKLKQVYEGEVNVLKESLDKQIILNNDLEQQMERVKEEFESKATMLKEKDEALEVLKGQFEELKSSSAIEIKDLQNELKKKVKEIAELEDNLSSFEEEHTSDVAQYEQNLQKQQEQTAELEKQLVLELGNESARYEQKLAETKAQLESKYKKAAQQLVERVKDLESENESLRTTHAQEIEAFRENLVEYTSGLEDQIRELQAGTQAEHKRELETVKAEHVEVVAKLEKELKTLSEGKEALKMELKTRAGDEQTGRVSEETDKVKEAYEEQIQTLKEQVQHEQERREKEVAEAADSKEKEFMGVIEEVLEKHQLEVSELKTYYEKLLQETGKFSASYSRLLLPKS